MDRVRTLFRRFAVQGAPKADELLNLCKETIQNLSAQYLSSKTEDDRTEFYLMNRHQCNFLVGKLTESRDTLEGIQLSPLLDEKTIPMLQELHQVFLDVETVINDSRIISTQWPRAAIEQSDMKETFANLLYGVQWHASVLLSILVDNSQESSITFEPALCGGKLSLVDELSLLTAMKKDEESLKDRFKSVKLNDPTANEFLNLKMQCEEEDLGNTSSVADNPTGFRSYPDVLFLNPEDLHCSGKKIGTGVFAVVRETTFMGGKYAMKIVRATTEECPEFDQEMTALQGLGRHPHIVRLLCLSKEDTERYLVMELMDEDLQTVLFEIKRERKRKKLSPARPFSLRQAVALMLQIGEGVKYIHSKRMAHRDLKPGNVLVNLDSSSRICAVKIADFGLTKTKDASHTCSDQTYNKGTSRYMAPEVIRLTRGDDPEEKSKFNPRKADVYSFAIICFEILTGEVPYYDAGLGKNERLMKEQVKAGTLRPNLPEDCPPKLVALIKRCWDPISHERPLFPEICKELRYIKGLLLRGDRGKSELQDIRPLGRELGPLGGAQIQGPWGGDSGRKFFDVGTSIKRIKLTYQSPGILGSIEMDYNLAGNNFVRKFSGTIYRDLRAEIVIESFELITHISGYVSKTHLALGPGKVPLDVVSLTIHTNIKSYGPFDDEEGEPFTSRKGRVIGFHGQSGLVLDSLGVVVIPDETM